MFVYAVAPSFAATPANAATATFVGGSQPDPDALAALSSSGDNSGLTFGAGETFGIVFDQPFATSRTDTISIFTLPPDQGRARITVRFGLYNNGSPSFVSQIRLNSGQDRSIGNLFNRGCRVFGGCDYIEFAINRLRGGATGAEVDYVDVNGDVVAVAAPTPEPGIWSLMILAFAAIGWRAKSLRAAGEPHDRRFGSMTEGPSR